MSDEMGDYYCKKHRNRIADNEVGGDRMCEECFEAWLEGL